MTHPMILFGPAGIPRSAKGKGLETGLREVKRLGLDCMEVEFVRGVRMSEKEAARLGEIARQSGVTLTAHGPYYINLCSPDQAKIEASLERVLQTARRCHWLGGQSVTFHAAYYQGRAPEAIFREVAARLREIMLTLRKEGVKIAVAPELTGKPSQFGSLAELIRLCRAVKGLQPCLDFAHYVARDFGEHNSYEGFREALLSLQTGLGPRALTRLHMHVSGIEWSGKGEVRHHRLKESGFNWKALLRALVDLEVSGMMICESPMMEDDAVILQKEYRKLAKGEKE